MGTANRYLIERSLSARNANRARNCFPSSRKATIRQTKKARLKASLYSEMIPGNELSGALISGVNVHARGGVFNGVNLSTPGGVPIDTRIMTIKHFHRQNRAYCSKIKIFASLAGPSFANGLGFAKDMTETQSQNRIIGYARVSTYGQTLNVQLGQLKAAGCAKTYREKASGAKAERRELQRMLKDLAPGDVVTVTRIDRLARSTFDLFSIVRQIVDAGGQFRSLAEPWADSSTSTGRLMLAVLGGLADVERDLIRTRTAEGRSRAMARGQHMGRPLSLTAQQAAEARQRRQNGATLQELADSYNVSRATISRLSFKG